MNNLVEYINKKTQDKFTHLRLQNAIFCVETKTVDITLLYRENCCIKDDEKVLIKSLCNEFLENRFTLNIKYVKNYLDEIILLSVLNQRITNGYPSLAVMINLEKTKIVLKDEQFKIDFYVASNFVEMESINKMLYVLNKELLNDYCYNFVFGVIEDVDLDLKNVLSVREEEIASYDVDKHKNVAKNYFTVFPEPFVELKQLDLFTENITIVNEELLNNDFVVFDLETTGLDPVNCKIIEIGAVKIEKGKIVQQFSTFINPIMHVPEQATKVNGITDDMLKNAPIFERVVSDFYKFCNGCTLVAHNAHFDMSFLNNASAKCGYMFDNPQKDTLFLAKQKLLGLRKYQLKTICEHLGISLLGAHRALNDTVATAKVFIKLMEKY